MPLSDYFPAPSDEAAARFAGPDVDPREPRHGVLSAKNVMPNWDLVPLEVFLTGRSEKEVRENPRNGMVVANVEDTVVVVTVSDELTASLVEASSDRLVEAAEAWSHFPGFQGADPFALAGFLEELADLARWASRGNQRLYCRLGI